MNLETLLSKLSKIGVSVVQRSHSPENGLEAITLSSKANFPFPEGHEHWHVLVLPIGQHELSVEEVEAVQRNLWKASVDLFSD